MDLIKEEPLRKSKSFTSSLCSTLFWSSSRSSSSSPMDTHQTHHPRLELGLKALASSSYEEKHLKNPSCIIRSQMLSSPPSPSPSPSPSSSLMDGKKEADCSVQEKEDNYGRGRRNRRKLIKREFPPPIPLLARTENLLCHMPWVLKRYYKSDGRLILQEERVKHHEYFRAHRANGRLTLQLVNLDVKEEKPEVYLDDEADGGPDQEDDDHEVMDGNDEKKHPLDDHEVDEEVLEESTMILASSMPEPLMGNGNGAGKCSRLNSDLFRMPIPTIRPVYT